VPHEDSFAFAAVVTYRWSSSSSKPWNKDPLSHASMYMLICTIMHGCACVCMCLCMCTCVCVYLCVHLCNCVYLCVHLCTCVYLCVHLCTYVCICVCKQLMQQGTFLQSFVFTKIMPVGTENLQQLHKTSCLTLLCLFVNKEATDQGVGGLRDRHLQSRLF